jgi:hypothetical protein
MANTPIPPGPAPVPPEQPEAMRNKANAPLSHELIASALHGLGLKYSCDSDGDFSMRFSGEPFGGALSIWVVVDGESKDILRTFATNYRNIPQSKWQAALVMCNDYHQNNRYGRAYLVFQKPEGQQPEPVLCFESQIALRYGTTEGFLKTFIVATLEGARKVFTMAHGERELY